MNSPCMDYGSNYTIKFNMYAFVNAECLSIMKYPFPCTEKKMFCISMDFPLCHGGIIRKELPQHFFIIVVSEANTPPTPPLAWSTELPLPLKYVSSKE